MGVDARVLVRVGDGGGGDGHVVQQAQLGVGALKVAGEEVPAQADGEGQGRQDGKGELVAFVVEGAQARFELGKNCWVGNMGVVEAAVF